jgi:ubiquinone/menaquinone biosynthesis C-methylase UbiE
MIGVELLDDPHADPAAVRRELADIARLNALFGGRRAVVREIERLCRAWRRGAREQRATWTLLDVGTGLGDIPRAARAAAERYGVALRLVGVELNRTAAAAARAADGHALALVLADGGRLPLGPGSVDVVVASQVLHHLPARLAVRWIASFDRLARRAVVLADLHRSRVAMAGVWLACRALGCDAVSRHDAVVSLQRGYTRRELNALLAAAGVPPVARYRPGYRVVAAWQPASSGRA